MGETGERVGTITQDSGLRFTYEDAHLAGSRALDQLAEAERA